MKDGLIEKCRIYSDCLLPDFITDLNNKIIGVKYDSEGIDEFRKILDKDFVESENLRKMGGDVCEWIK